jgi:hypothetical protein
MKKFKLIGKDKTHYVVVDENGQPIGYLDELNIRVSNKELRPLVVIVKHDGTVEEGLIDSLEVSGTIVPTK